MACVRRRCAALRAWLVAGLLGASSAAQAQLIDSVNVERSGKEARISIRFTATVQYLRHTPQDSGKTLLIYLQVTGVAAQAADFGPQTVSLPQTDLVPHLSVTYPVAGNALEVDFSQPTSYNVSWPIDGRSIDITVPILAGARDWAIQVKAPPPSAPARRAPPAAAQAPEAPQAAVAAPAAGAAAAAATAAAAAAAAAPTPTAPVAPTPAPQRAQPAAPAQMPATTKVMPKVTPLTPKEVAQRAKEWMDAARAAIAARKGVVAAQRLNQVLSLPVNSRTEEAQALMGRARELSGELSKAKLEYELYLKQYPRGKHVAQVKERLANLGKTVARVQSARGPGGRPQPPPKWNTFGSVSQYYYTGKSQIEIITPPPPGQLVFNRDTLSLTDQNALISTIDVQGRRADAGTDTRIVFRDADTRNFLEGQTSYNRLNSAYVEQTYKRAGLFYRVGRQIGSGAGVFGRFDGANLGYKLTPTWRLNVVGGVPVEWNTPFHRSFYGASIDYSPPPGRLGLSGYVIQQKLEGYQDRRAVGAELRYFDPHATLFGTIDYDLNFKQLNILMLQTNWRTDGGTNYFANLDVRKSPPLSLVTALPGRISLDPTQPTLDFRQLFFTSVANLGVEGLRTEALKLTSDSYLFGAGFTRPVSKHWQLGADYRAAEVTGTEASGILPASPGSGISHVLSGQALGNNLLRTHDTLVSNLSLIAAETYKGVATNVTYVLPLSSWRLDSTIVYYVQRDDFEQRQTRLTPSLRLVYDFTRNVHFELQAGEEQFDDTGPLRETHTVRDYVYAGYRWDFH